MSMINRFEGVVIVPGVRRPDGEPIKLQYQYSRIGPDDDIMLWPPYAQQAMTLDHTRFTHVVHSDGKITVNELFSFTNDRGAWQGGLRHGYFHMRLRRAFVEVKPITANPTIDD